jgi:hypothetical protein
LVNVNPNAQTLKESALRRQTRVYAPKVIGDKEIGLVICPRTKFIGEIALIAKSEYPSVKSVISFSEAMRQL